ncbi:hypothetical protein V5O48_015855 [Marasmius crinis-equi]|uniref:Uncharacterized protein n=1 Tax=Marasmius crinis-equi TaxID=585013 RepID=A0ABR3ETC9_9AGAR
MSTADTEPETVHYSTSLEGITTITLDRAQRRNAVNPATANAFLRFEEDTTQKICETSRYYILQSAQSKATLGPSRMTITKPVICAVSGCAVTGGLELSLLSDIRIVEEVAIFGVFCQRWGVPLIDGGTVRLQAIVGLVWVGGDGHDFDRETGRSARGTEYGISE